jgi:hypothetical protein
MFLAGGRILGAADPHAVMPAGDAHIATDALANLVAPTLGDLARQEGIRDRRPRRTDEIENAAANLRHHGVWRGETADADHGL